MNQTTAPALARQLNLPLLVLYGLGTTIGAGVYALLGDISATAGYLAPWSFLCASLIAAFTAFSFAELASRYPRAGATALYIEAGFERPRLGLLVGLLLVVSALTSSAALLNGLVGYLQAVLPATRPVLVTGVLLATVAVAAWGIRQSALLAGVISVIEIGGVLWLAGVSLQHVDATSIDVQRLLPDAGSSAPILLGATLAFYAYIGFEDMVEVAEEVTDVRRTLPFAILITLIITSLLYLLLITSTLLAVGAPALAASTAPFADVYRHLTGQEPLAFLAIGILAILNGALIQIIMASRVLYGLASRGALPGILARVNARTHTPLVATALVGALVWLLAITGTLGKLANATSMLVLAVFCLANLALLRLKLRSPADPPPAWQVPALVPVGGALTSAGLLLHALLS